MNHENSGSSNETWRAAVVKYLGQNQIVVYFDRTDELVVTWSSLKLEVMKPKMAKRDK